VPALIGILLGEFGDIDYPDRENAAAASSVIARAAVTSA
jgi:hypothetical protein